MKLREKTKKIVENIKCEKRQKFLQKFVEFHEPVKITTTTKFSSQNKKYKEILPRGGEGGGENENGAQQPARSKQNHPGNVKRQKGLLTEQKRFYCNFQGPFHRQLHKKMVLMPLRGTAGGIAARNFGTGSGLTLLTQSGIWSNLLAGCRKALR